MSQDPNPNPMNQDSNPNPIIQNRIMEGLSQVKLYPLEPLGLLENGLDWIFTYPTRNREKHSLRDNLD